MSLCICAVSPEPLLLAHTSSESRGTFRQKARSLAPLNSWVCAVKICHDRMLEDTNSLDAPHFYLCRWNTFRMMCDNNKRISVALEITADLPSEEILQRWLAEPVKAVIVSTSLFLTNKKGYPVLSKVHQSFLRSLFKV